MKKDLVHATYLCKRHTGFGIDYESKIVCGLTLEIVEGNYDIDLIAEDIGEAGADAPFLLPEGGLEEGALYSARVTNISRDWESGVIDGWDIEIYAIDAASKSEGGQ